MQSAAQHYPVMLPEMIGALIPTAGEVYVDGTFGAGGYARAILEAADCTVIAIDRDPAAWGAADALAGEYGARFVFLRGRFGDVERLLQEAGVGQVDGFVLDLGVSSMQIDQAERGFSFRAEGPLDMRMDSEVGQSAADFVNETDERELADLIYNYGGERYSRRVARKICERRKAAKLTTTRALAELVREVVPKAKDGIDPATRTFQALRIAVNDEIGELERALAAAERILRPGGRLVVVSFHSLEDGTVKKFLMEKAGRRAGASRHMPAPLERGAPVFRLASSRALRPSAQEVVKNPRSRSARMRAAIKLEAA